MRIIYIMLNKRTIRVGVGNSAGWQRSSRDGDKPVPIPLVIPANAEIQEEDAEVLVNG